MGKSIAIQSAIIKKELTEEEYQELEYKRAWASKLGRPYEPTEDN